ncbi:hypothetical protein CMQ_7208 [Grosmannia clavigera kw1407]|uniref:Uncharacterized protein n=1 Tax=Grosmannia clavigera (strain kw1407 / UAMH 11150) TaxID=655863 RepID=F0XP90_GROCL|nr:uncharacterized protein CMQ_7208 [Grosmannia clavigera kw1407]EFX00206.1 hypothetical protein CMQ_7208 [Grosmannia clavigera kw1407]
MAMNAMTGASVASFDVPFVQITDVQASRPTKVSSTYSDLTPEAYLGRIGGVPTTAAHEIWAAAHSLSMYLSSARTEEQKRVELGRNLVRLCMRHRETLLKHTVNSSLEACVVCRNVSVQQGSINGKFSCCWFHPKNAQQALLTRLEVIGDYLYKSPEDLSDEVILKLFGSM